VSKIVAQVIVETLQSAGVKNCYGIVGDTLNTFATSLSRSDIKFVHMRHEEAGAYAAQAEALLMDRLTAMASSCGPAVYGMAMYSIKAVMHGKAGDVFEMIGENL
jgi:pyruvate dehydrogenase (quinone)